MPLRLIPDDTNLPFMKWARIRTPISLALIVLSFVLFFTIGRQRGHRFQGRHRHRGAEPCGDRRSSATMRAKVDGLGLGDVQVQDIGSDDRRADPRRRCSPAASRPSRRSSSKVADGARLHRLRLSRASRWSGRASRASSPAAGTLAVAVHHRRHHGLHLVPLRMAVRHRRGGDAGARRDPDRSASSRRPSIDFNLSSIAAILTIIGYSLNDTVVIFDRIREILRKLQADAGERHDRPRHQPDAGAHDHDVADAGLALLRALLLRRAGDPLVHRRDDLGHLRRHRLVDLHRRPDPHLLQHPARPTAATAAPQGRGDAKPSEVAAKA